MPGGPTNLNGSGAWSNCVTVSVGENSLDILSFAYHLFSISLSLGDGSLSLGDGSVKTEILSQRAVKVQTTNFSVWKEVFKMLCSSF